MGLLTFYGSVGPGDAERRKAMGVKVPNKNTKRDLVAVLDKEASWSTWARRQTCI